jgi:hypothetical protein
LRPTDPNEIEEENSADENELDTPSGQKIIKKGTVSQLLDEESDDDGDS